MNVQVVFFFESVQPATKYASAALGWTESVYGFSPTINDLDSWLGATDVQTYIDLRRATMPQNYRIAWVRVADQANPRSFKIRAVTAGFGTIPPINPMSQNPQGILGQATCALLVDLARLPDGAGDHTHHRKFLMRGLPADVIHGNVVNEQANNFAAIQTFFNWLAFKESGAGGAAKLPNKVVANTTLGVRYQNPANLAFTPAAAITVDPADPQGISMATAIAGTPGQHYVFRNFQANERALNRTWQFRASLAGPPGATLFGRARKPLPGGTSYTPPGPGQYRLVVPLYNLFSQYTIIGLRTKKTGRLFRQLRGRASTR